MSKQLEDNQRERAGKPLKILRLPAVKARTGLSQSTIYLRMAGGGFPRPVSLGGRAVGWIEAEIDDFLKACLDARESGS